MIENTGILALNAGVVALEKWKVFGGEIVKERGANWRGNNIL